MLREKEKGDWKKLSQEEIKTLYRFSFRQTLSEVNAPTGEWKKIFGMAMMAVSFGMFLYVLEKHFGTYYDFISIFFVKLINMLL